MPDYIDTRIVLGPNASLSWQQGRGAIVFMAFVGLMIGGFFALHGLWPVLPFCGLEVAAFAVALVASLRKNGYREVLCFEGDVLRVEFGTTSRGATAVVTLQRPQTRVLLEKGPHRNSPTTLSLNCCGQRVDVARCLTDEERAALRCRIRQLIHPGWQADTPVEDAELRWV